MIPPLSPSPAGKNALLNKNMKVYRTVDCFNGFGMTNILVSLHVVIVAFEFSRSVGARLGERHNGEIWI